MKTVHCDIWENSVTCFADDLNGDDDVAVSFTFADHDVDTFDYVCHDERIEFDDATYH